LEADPRGEEAATRWSAVFGGALLGAGVAILVARRLPVAPAAGQIPGFALVNGLDPRRDLARYLVFLALVAAGALAGRKTIARLEAGTGYWATRLRRPAPWMALSSAPIIALTDDAWPWVLLSTLTCFAAAVTWRPARRGSRPSLVAAGIFAQTMIAWSFLGSTPLAKWVPLFPLLVLLTAWFAAIAHGGTRRTPERGILTFSPSLVLVPIALWRTHPPPVDLAAGIVAVVLPLAISRLPPRAAIDRMLRATLPLTLATAFVTLGGQVFLRPAPVANLFEDGHALLPASEYLAGRLPYRDIVPGHGLVSDGLLQAGELRIFGADYRGLSRGNRLVGALYWPLIFCLGVAASGLPEVGFWGVALSFFIFPQYFFLRVMAPFALLATAAAARRRAGARGWWVATGVLIPLSLLWAVEFAFYGAVAALASIFVSRGTRLRNLKWTAAGTLAGSAAVAGALAALGIFRVFVTTTFRFIPSLAPAYSLGFVLPPALAPPLFPDSLAALADPLSFSFWCLLLAIFGAAILLVEREAAGERGRALLPFLVWILAVTISVIERHHLTYASLVAGPAIVLSARWIAGAATGGFPRRAAAAVLVAWAVVVTHPVRTMGAIASALAIRPPSPQYVYPTGPVPLRGAAVVPDTAATIASAGDFVSRYLGPRDTWLDFTSTPALYFYFGRRCPIRFYEVGFFETSDAQKEVIRAVDRNPFVRAVLVHLKGGGEAIDGVPNAVRAPLVWGYIQHHFHPAFASETVAFWMRNDPGPASAGTRAGDP
jgi:hypothetical protein